jgi:hypothetical protein
MNATYDVRIWKTEVYKGQRGNTYYVRWQVAGKRWKEPFKSAALAESFRSELVAATRKGEAFDTDTGRPVSMQRSSREMSWYEFACTYVDMKWPHVAATTRRTHAEAFTALTTQMFTTERGKPDDKVIRAALCRGRSTRPNETTRTPRPKYRRPCGGSSAVPDRWRRWPTPRYCAPCSTR